MTPLDALASAVTAALTAVGALVAPAATPPSSTSEAPLSVAPAAAPAERGQYLGPRASFTVNATLDPGAGTGISPSYPWGLYYRTTCTYPSGVWGWWPDRGWDTPAPDAGETKVSVLPSRSGTKVRDSMPVGTTCTFRPLATASGDRFCVPLPPAQTATLDADGTTVAFSHRAVGLTASGACPGA